MPTDYGFTGQHADVISGLDYYGARYYDPVGGQFTSADTILPGGGFDVWGLSRYAYVEGDPVNFTDPSGYCSTAACYQYINADDGMTAVGHSRAGYSDPAAVGEAPSTPTTSGGSSWWQQWIHNSLNEAKSLAGYLTNSIDQLRKPAVTCLCLGDFEVPKIQIMTSGQIGSGILADPVVSPGPTTLINVPGPGLPNIQITLPWNRPAINLVTDSPTGQTGPGTETKPGSNQGGPGEQGGVIYVDPGGNAIEVPPGGSITGSPDSRWIQVRGPDGEPTGVRIDNGHPSHGDPRARGPHAHVPGVTNPDGTPWLPTRWW